MSKANLAAYEDVFNAVGQGEINPEHQEIAARFAFASAQRNGVEGVGSMMEAARDRATDAQGRAILDRILNEQKSNQDPKQDPNHDLGDRVFPIVGFEFDSAELTEQGLRQATELGDAMRSVEFEDCRFLLVGHTDVRGSAEYNIDLSRRRASRLRDWLIERFEFDPDRIKMESRGEEEPTSFGNSQADHARNRRAQLHFVDRACVGRKVSMLDKFRGLFMYESAEKVARRG